MSEPPPEPPNLPSYLLNTDPLEPEDLALQVALLTMEAAQVRTLLLQLGRTMSEALSWGSFNDST